MTSKTEAEALQAVESAKAALADALNMLREARGEPDDESCRHCKGEGKQPSFTSAAKDDEVGDCFDCKGTGRQKKSYPLVVTGIRWSGTAVQPPLLRRGTTWVSIRPCAEEHGGKTYLGWLLGDIACSQMAQPKHDGTLEISMCAHNPAIFVPDLGKIVYGYESWWGPLKTPDDLKKITDSDIENVWYVKALNDLTAKKSEAD